MLKCRIMGLAIFALAAFAVQEAGAQLYPWGGGGSVPPGEGGFVRSPEGECERARTDCVHWCGSLDVCLSGDSEDRYDSRHGRNCEDAKDNMQKSCG
jgi:hypothetical protein